VFKTIEKFKTIDHGDNVKNCTRIRFLQTLLVLLVMMGLCPYTEAASTTVWRIGKFDRSSLEFTRRDAQPPKPGPGQIQSDVV
jgi:hypothetical protein